MDESSEIKTLLEQYKIYVDMADKVSSRRATANQFFITMLVAELAIASFLVERAKSSNFEPGVLAILSIFGIALCLIWGTLLRSYRQLNQGKYKVIHEMEKRLPFRCFDVEWEVLAKGRNSKVYLPLTIIESAVPYALAVPFCLLLVMSFFLYRSAP